MPATENSVDSLKGDLSCLTGKTSIHTTRAITSLYTVLTLPADYSVSDLHNRAKKSIAALEKSAWQLPLKHCSF